MFTGIIEEVGTVESIEPRAVGSRLKVHCKTVLDDVFEGASISVNGVCLTAVAPTADSFCAEFGRFDSHGRLTPCCELLTHFLDFQILLLETRRQLCQD